MNLDELKTSLATKQQELKKRIVAIENDFKKGRSQDFAEQTTETENDQVLDEIHHEAKLELSQVNEALSRIDNGNYGRCEQCDELINPQRLNALPYTNTCINCAQ